MGKKIKSQAFQIYLWNNGLGDRKELGNAFEAVSNKWLKFLRCQQYMYEQQQESKSH